MTAKNSILLIIKQSPGIDYNALLNRVSANYSSVNSARAALSRALKDLSIFGLVVRRNKSFFATDKAVILVNQEMKNKLILKLNKTINSGQAEHSVDSVVQQLQTMLERAKQDKDLLKAAKGSTDFYISDLALVGEKVESQAKHLEYMSKVFREQIEALKELGFNDIERRPFDEGASKSIEKAVEAFGLSEVVFKSDEELVSRIASEFSLKAKNKSISFPASTVSQLISRLLAERNKSKFFADLYLSPIKLKISNDFVYFIGPFYAVNDAVRKNG